VSTFAIGYRDPARERFTVVIEAPDGELASAVWRIRHPPRFGYRQESIEELPDGQAHLHYAEHQAEVAVCETLSAPGTGWRAWFLIVFILLLTVGTGMLTGYFLGMRSSSGDPLPDALLGLGLGTGVGVSLSLLVSAARRPRKPPDK
jgi:hypothetical protein